VVIHFPKQGRIPAATQVHASILRMATPFSRGLVFTTKTFSENTQYFLRTRTEDRKVKKSLDSNYSENVLKNIQITSGCGRWASAFSVPIW
jgi:hypothetical protein